MKKSLLVVIFVVLAISAFAKGTCTSGVAEPTHEVLDLNSLRLASDTIEATKAELGNEETGSRDWQTVKDESFEGAWPNDWNCYSTQSLDCYWSDNNDQSSAGSWSGWCADGGDDAPVEQTYLNNMHTYMTYGPFSLADATDADVEFDMWYETESDYDYVKVMASTDGTNFYGTQWSGNSNGWDYHNFDLTDVFTLGNVTGQNQVWIAFIFSSDVSNCYEGAYIDQINIDKYYEAPTYLGAPSIYSVSLENEIDANGNGFYEEFCLEIDVDATSASSDVTYRAEDCYISVYRDDNGTFLGEWGPFSFSDMQTGDNVIVGPFADLVGYNATDLGLEVVCENDLGSDSDVIYVNVEAGNVQGDNIMTVANTTLIGNYPNPFNPVTFINYNLAENGPVEIKIYNVKGELVRNLLNSNQQAGTHSVMWDGKISNGKSAGSGVYFYHMVSNNFSASKRMIMLK